MQIKTYSTDGDFFANGGSSNITHKEKTSFVVFSNIDVATITFGIADGDDHFSAYSDGVVTSNGNINHGAGMKLMVRIAGIVSNPVKIGFSS